MQSMKAEQDHLYHVSQAFSLKAGIYDEFGKDHPNLARMRQKVYQHVLNYLKTGMRILEINAGTGIDAAYFAGLGYQIHATDLSPGMLASIQAKIEQRSLQNRLSAQLCSFTELAAIRNRPFDYLFSNFGGLNCIDDLALITRQLPGVLVPGGYLTWVIMPPICPWDLAMALKGDFRTAFRRLRSGGTLANVEGVRFKVRYFTPEQVLRSLGGDFHLRQLEGLSIFTPPADHKNFARRFPSIYRLLVRLDDHLSMFPIFRGWGDFFILTAQYQP